MQWFPYNHFKALICLPLSFNSREREREMSDPLGGAVLGAIMGELLTEVLAAKRKVTNFKPALELLESTLKNIVPRLEEIGHLKKKDHSFDLKSDDLEELVAIVNKGKQLVLECSSISSINVFKIIQYSNALQLLDDSLRRYFTTILPLDHFRNDLEMLNMVKELHKKLIVGNDEGSSSQSESGSIAEKPKKNEEETVKEEAKKSYPEKAKKMYEKRTGKKLFLLKGCTYDFDLEDLENPDHHEVLGKGTYGTSYKCYTKYGAVVVKRLNLELNVGEREFKERMEEIGKIGSHPNIMLPFGYYYSKLHKFLLYDYAPAGNFNAFLKESRSLKSYWNPRLKIAIGVARGISHIHSEGGVIHGNIKPSSVLLTKDLDGCIFDFGLAPIMNFPAKRSTKLGIINLELSDPPELNETMVATQKSDVFYFGILLCELLPKFELKLLWHPYIQLEVNKVAKICRDCLQENPNRRPKMDEVVRMLQNV